MASWREQVAPDWADALAPMEPTLASLGTYLREEIAAGRGYLPASDAILRSFETPMAEVRVLIVGQDPYPTPGDPVGLSFSVPRGHPLPRSLQNMARELRDDTGERVYNVPVALSIMVFFALCAQCAATLVVICRETNSWRWPAFTFTYMTALAYLGALATYQIGTALAG